jgi:hypothetical protein
MLRTRTDGKQKANKTALICAAALGAALAFPCEQASMSQRAIKTLA